MNLFKCLGQGSPIDEPTIRLYPTGEFRSPKIGEYYLDMGGALVRKVYSCWPTHPRIILRPENAQDEVINSIQLDLKKVADKLRELR